MKKQKSEKINANAFEAIQSTKLGEKVNPEQLKTLLGSSPQEPQKPAIMKLEKMFDPFMFSSIL